MKTAYVILLNWNGWRDTIECLNSLLKTEGVRYRIVICDNASTDGSAEHIREWASQTLPNAYGELTRSDVDAGKSLADHIQCVLLHNGGNLGFAGGNNVGIRLAMQDANCTCVWLLNNDTTVEPDSLALSVQHMMSDSNIGLCGSTLIYYHDRDKVQAWGGARYSPFTGGSAHIGAFAPSASLPQDIPALEASMSYVIGAAMLVRREFIERIGLMSEDYFLYYEEIDWATRGARQFRLAYAAASRVYHKEGASIGTSASGGSPLSVFYLYRNRIRFTWRYYRLYLPSVLAKISVEILKMCIRGRLSLARAAIRGTMQLSRATP